MKEINQIPAFKRFCMTVGNLPTAFMESMTYYEALQWLVNYIETVIIPTINNNGEAITELQESFVTLKNYVDDYFDNLDIQTEINNKLDEMAEDGTLENLISQYIELQTTYVYNNVAEMKQATNLVDGSFARTSGFYEYNDGGGAYYKIRTLINTDVVDNMHLFTLDNTDNLVAELIVNDFNILKFGAQSGEDITNIINYVLSIVDAGDIIEIPTGEFTINSPLIIDKIITIKGTSLATNNGSKLIFTTNGFLLRNSNITLKNLDISGTKDNYSTLNIDNNVFGKSGIICEYTDTYSSGGVKVENCNIHGFNVGVVIYSTRTSNKWSGAYRTFRNCEVTYNDIGYIIKDGATFNSIIGGHISANDKYGLYVNTNVFYENVEVIDVALEINGQQPPFITEIASFGTYVNGKSKVKFTNSYLEQNSVFVDSGASVVFISCHIHSNVPCYGNGQILSEGSHGIFSNNYDFGNNLAANTTNTGLTVNNTYGTTAKIITITSSTIGDIRLNFPNLDTIPIPLKNIEFIKFEFDAKVTNGYQNSNFGLKLTANLYGFGNNNSDNMNIENNYSLKNIKPINEEWSHLTYYWKPRISEMDDPSNIIYRLSTYLFFNNSIDNDNIDFSSNNLNMMLANPTVTIYGNSKV